MREGLRSGRLWEGSGGGTETGSVLQRITDSLWGQGLLSSLLRKGQPSPVGDRGRCGPGYLDGSCADSEVEKLGSESVKGLGGPKHVSLIRQLIDGAQEAAAAVVLAYAAQVQDLGLAIPHSC